MSWDTVISCGIKVVAVSANALYVPVGDEPIDAFSTKAWVVEGGGVLVIFTAQEGATVRPVVLQCPMYRKFN